MAAAGLATAFVVHPGGDHWDPLMASGAVALEPTLVAPGHPSTARLPSERGGTSSTPRRLGVRVNSVGGLYPGHRVKVRVRYRNPYSFPIRIHKVRVRARGTAQCTGRQLMRPKAPRPRISAHSAVRSNIKVGMRRRAPDSCQGVRFAIHVRATAVKL